MKNSDIGNLLNVASPGTFLSTYAYLMRNQKQNSRRTLIATTRRLLVSYRKAEGELAVLKTDAENSIVSWFKTRRAIKAAKRRLEKLKNDIFSWVDKTINFFVPDSNDSVFQA